MERKAREKVSSQSEREGGGAERAEGKQKQLGEKVSVFVGGHIAKSCKKLSYSVDALYGHIFTHMMNSNHK